MNNNKVIILKLSQQLLSHLHSSIMNNNKLIILKSGTLPTIAPHIKNQECM